MQPCATSSILILRAKTHQHVIHGLRVISSNLWGLWSTIAPTVAPTVIQSLIKVLFRHLSSGVEKHFHFKWFCKHFSQCDSRNMNLSPICDLSKTSLASWRPSAQCAFCQVCFPSNRTSWDISQKLRLDKLFNIYLSLLVRLEGKHDFEGNRDFQTLNLGFPGHFDRFWVFQK